MNSRTKVLAALALILGLGMVLSGCGSSKPPIAITLGPSGTQNVVAGQAVNVTATVANDSKTAGVTWSLTGPGALSAQSTTSVTYTAPSPISANGTATITATSVSDTTKTATLTINLQAVSIALTPSAAQTLEQTQTVSVTAMISNDPSTTPSVTWSLNAGAKGTLSGQTATGVTYKAPASVTAAATDTITATSAFDNTKTATLTINLVLSPSITTTSPLPAGTVGTAYSTTVVATGGVTPYAWSWTAQAGSSLPAGLSIGSSTGTISGMPTAYGTFNVTVQVKDANNFTATANLSIKINPAPVVITTTSLPNGVVNTAYGPTTLMSTGGATPITWSWAAQAGSTLPPGLVLAPTGTISGTPTSAGTFNVTVTATDSSTPPLTASKNFSITIIPQLVITSSSPLPNGITNTAYSATLASTGGSGAVIWTLSGGTTLPANLSLNPSTGAITGTPTAAGTFNFTVQAADSGTPQQKVTKSFTITIIQQLVITTPPALPTGSVTTPYSVQLASSGGTGAVTWAFASGSTPPGGLGLSATGLLSGIPTTANTFHFSITATDSGTPPQTATVAFTLTITPKLAITTPSPLPSGFVGTAYSTTIMTNNGGIAPISWSWIAQAGSTLPPGLNINSSTGVISGTPSAGSAGTYNVTVTATDSSKPTAQTASANFSISIATAPLSISTTSLPNGVNGQAYSATVVSAGGNPPVSWSWTAQSGSSLPPGLSIAPGTGVISGTPSSTGTFNVAVKATDSTTPTAQTVTKNFTIIVVTALSITTASLPNGTVGSSYNTTVAATGGTTPYAWSWAPQTGSSLPPGLGINSTTGAITGTPGGSGATYNVTVTVTDATSPQQTASANFSITITVATLMVTTSSLPNGTVSTAYPNTQLNATGGIPPYSWAWVAQSGSSIPPGLSLSAGGQITGTPTTAGTFNVTVTATDSATPPAHTANANLSVTVSAAATCTSGGSESLLNGGYAFVLKGFDSSGNPALVGGVLTFNGTGGITAGAIDMNLNAGVQTNLSVTSGSYHVTSDQRGCMVITTAAGTQNYRFSLGNISSGVASTGHVIGFDTSGPFTAGVMRKQSSGSFSPATLNGSFSFGASSIQNSAFVSGGVAGGKFGIVGVITFNGNGGITGGSEDINQNGTLDGTSTTAWPTNPISLNSTGSSYTVATNGRGTLTVAVVGTPVIFHEVLYVVSSSEVLFLASDAQTTNSIVAGQALQQSGTLSGTPLSGAYIGYQSALGSTAGTSRTALFLLNASGSGISGTQLRNDGGSFQSKTLTGITYSVTSSGRMTVTGGGGTGPIFYLVSPNQIFALNGNSSVDTGFFQSQTGTSASGTYAFGVIDPQGLNVSDESGVATFTTSISGISDGNSSGSQKLGSPFGPQSYSIDSTGLGVIPSGCSTTAVPTTCQTVFYVISPTKAVVMDIGSTNNTNTRIEVADQ